MSCLAIADKKEKDTPRQRDILFGVSNRITQSIMPVSLFLSPIAE